MHRIAVHVARLYVPPFPLYRSSTDPTQCSTGSTCQSGACTSPPPAGDPNCPNASACNMPVSCGSSCYCVRTTSGLNRCLTLSGCGGAGQCTVDSDCGADGFCVTSTCCPGNICLKRTTCPNGRATSRLFRRAEAQRGHGVVGNPFIPMDV
jgi:hypothetical protein